MDRSHFNTQGRFAPARRSGKRRPAGVSRRQKQRQLGFETLEERRVLSAASGVDVQDELAAAAIAKINAEVASSFSSAADLSQYESDQLDTAESWVVLASGGTTAQQIQADTGLSAVSADVGIDGAFLVSASGLSSEQLIETLGQSSSVRYFYPDIATEGVGRALPNDPYLDRQWHLINFGQQIGNPDFQFIYATPDVDINIEEAWESGITGAGVVIGVVDDAVQLTHPDLAANARPDLSFDFVNNDNNPNPVPNSGDYHGTAVAGLAAAVGNNGIGVTGVAHGAGIAGLRLLGLNQTDFTNAQALFHKAQEIDVYNNSWGPVDGTRQVAGPGPLTEAALRSSVFFGRGGLGTIHMWASGNGGGSGDSSNYDGFVNSRYTIGVGGIDHDGIEANVDGTSTNYPEIGPSVLIVAPTGSNPQGILRDRNDGAGGTLGAGLFTTDVSGDTGYNAEPGTIVDDLEGDSDYFPDLDYTSHFNGTSAATPVAAGVVALMLEANPNLTYRDVQHILVRSASELNRTDPSWQVNNLEVFRDPQEGDPYPLILSSEKPVNQFANGAGFTVSHDRNAGGESGYAHGLINASLAVELAKNWKSVGTQVSELTYTSGASALIQGAATLADNTLIPGGLAGLPIADEWYNGIFGLGNDPPDPAGDDFPASSMRGDSEIFLTVPDTNTMSVEWVEVQVTTTGVDNNLLRLSLVSPDGTHSELNDFGVQGGRAYLNDLFTGGTPVAGGAAPAFNSWTLSTNRHWGERSDTIIDPDTMEELGWRLVVENYSDAAGSIRVSYAFHGQSIVNSGRITGAVGIDENRDGMFDNFDRSIEVVNDLTGLSDFFANPTQEKFASGVIVYAEAVGGAFDNDVRDPTEAYFHTGYDGNFYFDLAPGEYEIRVDASSLDDGVTIADMPVGTFTIGEAGERVAGANFTLDPGVDLPSAGFTISGNVYVDMDANGVKDGSDVGLEGQIVYFDANQNDVYDAGLDPVDVTDANGDYDFTIPEASDGFYDLELTIDGPWEFFSPVNGVQSVFLTQGDAETGVNFGVVTPGTPGGGGGNNGGGGNTGGGNNGGGGTDPNAPGAISGIVFEDVDGDGVRDLAENGVGGVVVYIDADGSNTFTAGETQVTTAAGGGYLFPSLPPGSHVVRAVTPSGFSQTAPVGDEHVVALVAGSVVSGREFGFRNQASLDWGDLPSGLYPTLSTQNGARHVVSNTFFLGSTVDGELEAIPTANADGDDNSNRDDDDGIAFDSIIAGQTSGVTAIANFDGGFLQGWMDFNSDGDFNDIVDGVSERVFTNRPLNAGANILGVQIPASATGVIYARFRYGEFGINSVTGFAATGEVEDYALTVAPSSLPLATEMSSDFNEDDQVDGFDFLAWQRGKGTVPATQAQGDADGDADVDRIDLALWHQDYTFNNQQSQFQQVTVSSEQTFVPSAATFASGTGSVERGFGSETVTSTVTADSQVVLAEPENETDPSSERARRFDNLVDLARRIATRAGVQESVLDRIEDRIDSTISFDADGRISIDLDDYDFERRDAAFERIASKIGSRLDENMFDRGDRGDEPLRERLFARLADGFSWRQI